MKAAYFPECNGINYLYVNFDAGRYGLQIDLSDFRKS